MLTLSSRQNPTKRWARGPQIVAILALAVVWLATVGSVDAQHYLEDIKALTSPAMEGRGDGTKVLTLAAQLIENRLKKLGLKPAGTSSYLQPFTVVTGARLRSGNRFTVQTGDSKSELQSNQDFVPFSFSSSGSASGALVFAGYGASANEFQYDDYGALDVKDKIVVVLRYEPAGFAAKTGHHGLTQHSQLVTKAINARTHGAKALVLVNGKLGDGEEDLLTRFGSVSGPENTGIILVQVKNDVAERWFHDAGKSLAEVQGQINHSTKPQSFVFPDSLHMTIHVDIETTRATVNNV